MNWFDSIHSEVNEIFVSNPYPKINEKIKIRICFLNNQNLQKIILRAIINGEETHFEMKYYEEKNKLTYYETELTINQKQINYHFIIKENNEYIYYNRKGIYSYPPTEDYDFVIITDFDNPTWVASSVFYQIFPDRFKNGDPKLSVKTNEYEFDNQYTIQMNWEDKPLEFKEGNCLDFFGGDLIGVKEKIGYLKELGVNAVYLNPIFDAKTHHRYDCVNYFKVDEHLGGDEALIELIDKLHENDMKIMLDVSINHTGINHIWFMKAIKDKQSEEREYYYFDEKNNYKGWLNVHTLPQLNYNSEKLKNIIYKDQNSLVKYYLNEPFNIDAWRFDVGCHTGRLDKDQLSNELWREVRKSIKEENKEAYIIGEHWEDNISYLLGDQWDGAMNYYSCGIPLRSFSGLIHRRLWGYEGRDNLVRKSTGDELAEQIMQHYNRLPNQIAFLQFNLLDSHDIFRFHNHEKAYNFNLYKGIVSLMYLLPGTPNIFYGDEVGLNGHIYTEEGLRYPMEWDKDKWNKDHFMLYKKLSHLKQNEKAMHYGNYKVLYSDNDTVVFSRYNQTDFIISILSRSNQKIIEIDTGIIGLFETSMEDIFDNKKLEVKNGKLEINLNEINNTVLKT